jgi:hypothetical protein
VGNLPFSVDSP